MKIKIMSLIIICFLIFTGCSSRQLGLENMINPPDIDEQFNLIYNSLKQTVGENIKLKYPINGENQGASFFIDENQALVFYEWSLKGFNDNNVRINFLNKNQNQNWVSVCDIGGSGSEIDKVSVLQDSQNNKYIAIGYLATNNNKQNFLEIYNFDGQMLNKIYSEYYMNFEIFDFSDKQQENIILTYKNSDNSVKTKILNINNMEVANENIVNMNNNVYEYVNVTKGYFNKQQKALFFDGKIKSDSLTTQIITFQDGKLVNLMSDTQLFDNTIRDKGIYSVDYNNDGLVEVPSILKSNILYDVKNIQKHTSLINWNNFSNNTYQTTFVDISLGYVFNIPDFWLTNITIKKTAESNEVVFIENYGSKNERQILKIKMYSNKDRIQFNSNENQFLIKEKGQFFYVGEVLVNSDDEFFISKEQVINNFYLYY